MEDKDLKEEIRKLAQALANLEYVVNQARGDISSILLFTLIILICQCSSCGH